MFWCLLFSTWSFKAWINFCNLSALPPGTCYGKAFVTSDANSGKTQGGGLAEQWIGWDVSPICRILTILPWKASLHSIHHNVSRLHHAWFYSKTLLNVCYIWNLDAFSPFSSFFSRLPRVCFLQFLFLLSIICQTCLGNIRRWANTTNCFSRATEQHSHIWSTKKRDSSSQ